jgi:SAM-dependent methyltransferase
VEERIGRISASYDRTIEFGNRGVDLYADLPDHITSLPAFREFSEATGCGSDHAAIRHFLKPRSGARFLDMGCSANIITHRLHEWPSEYFGIDSSVETVRLLERYVAREGIRVGGIRQSPIDRMPFPGGFFDIAACVGVLEYYPIEYAAKVLPEAYRTLKDGARFYVDIPNVDHPGCAVMEAVEEYMGRPIVLKVAGEEFERLLSGLFSIARVDPSRIMTGYYLERQG